jgi:hypothetical protein
MRRSGEEVNEMDEETTKAVALMSSVLAHSTVLKLYHFGKITGQEALEIYEDALQNLETNQIFAAGDPGPVLIARAMIEQTIALVRTALQMF